VFAYIINCLVREAGVALDALYLADPANSYYLQVHKTVAIQVQINYIYMYVYV